MKLLKSELRKVVYSKTSWGLLIASIFIAVISTVITPIVIANDETGLFESLQDQAMVDGVYANAISSYIFSIILGILIMAGEFRHGTAVATFLASPKRQNVLFAKLAIAGIAGAVMQLISVLVAILAGWVTLSFFDNVAAPSAFVFVNVIVAGLASGFVLAIIGVALGSLIRNQLVAIVSTLVWLFILEPIILLLFVDAGKWLPTGAITGMLSIDFESEALGVNTGDYLAPGLSTLVLLGYGAIFAVVALLTSLKKDVD